MSTAKRSTLHETLMDLHPQPMALYAVQGQSGSEQFTTVHLNAPALQAGMHGSIPGGLEALLTSFMANGEPGQEVIWNGQTLELQKHDAHILVRWVTATDDSLTDKIIDASVSALFVAEAIRDEKGEVKDLLMKRINPAFTKLIGKTEAEVIGKTYLTLWPGAERSGIFSLNAEVIQTGRPARKEIHYHSEHLNGWYDVSIVKLGDGILVTFNDITRDKVASQEVETQKNLLDNILQFSPSGISVSEVIRDTEGKVVDGRTILANAAAIQFTGIPEEILLHRTIREIDPGLFDSELFRMALQTMETGNPSHTQYFIDSSQRWIEISVARLDADRLINVFADITSTKLAQLEVEKSVEELKRSNAYLEEFAYAASHDMKEPIRKIHYFANRIREQYGSQMDEMASHYFERLEVATERMRALVDDLLAYSHVSMKPTMLDWVDLNEKLQNVQSDLEHEIEAKGATIEAGPLPTIRAHRRQMQQLFQNLLGNALKYSKPGIPPHITISATIIEGRTAGLHKGGEEERYHLIEVRDNGIGFDQKDAERIFNVFQRLHGNTEFRGTGVGLAIVRKVMDHHNGFITAEGRPGAGAVFRLYFPVSEA